MSTVQPGGYSERPRPSGLADVIDVILDKGLVVDAYARVSLIGIELVVVDARIAMASVDTYLRFAEAVSRLAISDSDRDPSLPQLIANLPHDLAKAKTKGVIQGAADVLTSRRPRS